MVANATPIGGAEAMDHHPVTVEHEGNRTVGRAMARGRHARAQAAVAKAVADSVADGVIPERDAENLVIVCGVFIHWLAADDKKIYTYNYNATKAAIANAMQGKPSAAEMVAKRDAVHPFRGF